MLLSHLDAVPAELVIQPNAPQGGEGMPQGPQEYNDLAAQFYAPQAGGSMVTVDVDKEADIAGYVKSYKTKIRQNRKTKEDIWTECWRLYRGIEDWSDKEEWQSKIVVPKSFNSIEQATSVIKRFLMSSDHVFSYDPVNPDDLITGVRAEQFTDLVKYFLEDANYIDEFALGLKSGFITGVGVWKLWWGYKPRLVTQIQRGMDPQTGQPMNQVVQQEVQEGKLFIRAIDPYNFFWLPGSRFNEWVGTIEDIKMPRWELMELAQQGVFGPDGVEKVKKLGTNTTDTDAGQKRQMERFQERPNGDEGPNEDTNSVRLTEFYGPLVLKDGVQKNYHCLIANDTVVLKAQENPFWHRKPPYVAFSPLTLPFRTEGVGLVEMVRQVDKAINKLSNLSVDTLLYRLLPVFEVNPEVYENPEDFETGLVPGKIFRRKQQYSSMLGIKPMEFQDVSQGAMAVQGQLDRSHQEGSLISEIQQAIPRFRGYQSATEIDAKQENIQSFFSAMAADIERQALDPLVDMAGDLVFQFMDTNGDQRIAAILGVGVETLRGMSKEELMDLVQGEYLVKVSGISGQLEKAEMLNSLVQFMNIIGQNSDQWMPYVNQDALLRRILEAFRPTVRDINNIIADPATVEARKAASQMEKLTPEIIASMTQQIDAAHQQQLAQQKQMMEMQQQQMQMQQVLAQWAHEEKLARIKAHSEKESPKEESDGD